MRCKACNAEMSDDDAVRKFPPDDAGDREYSDMCFDCYSVAVEVLYDNYEEPESYGEFYATQRMPSMQE